jgi:hypothetical protein
MREALAALVAACVTYAVMMVLVVPIERDAARDGYVKEARAVAAESSLAEVRRQVDAGATVIQSYQEIAKNQFTREQAQAEENERQIAEYERQLQDAGRSCALTPADIDFLRGRPGNSGTGGTTGAGASPR